MRVECGPGHRRGAWGLGTDGPGPGATGSEASSDLPAGLVAKIFAVVLIPSEWRAAIAHLGNFI